jgi:FkbM family methyltransferase
MPLSIGSWKNADWAKKTGSALSRFWGADPDSPDIRNTLPDARSQVAARPVGVVSSPAALSSAEPGSLLADQRAILGADARTIVDVGAHNGHSTRELLDTFPNARVLAFEAERRNFIRARDELAPYGSRVEIFNLAVSDAAGETVLHVNSHDGTHSLFGIGEQRYWAGHAHHLEDVAVQSTPLDEIAVAHGLDMIDILKLDIQGAELSALKGARRLLEQNRIRLIATEVEFQLLYEGQPLFWEIGAYLQQFGFGFYKLYDCAYHAKNAHVLSWADAIFLGPEFLDVSGWEP